MAFFYKDTGFVMLSVFSATQKIVFHGMKWNNTMLHLPWSRSHSFVLTIFLLELLRLFNSYFTLFQIINTMQEIGDQAKKTLIEQLFSYPLKTLFCMLRSKCLSWIKLCQLSFTKYQLQKTPFRTENCMINVTF